MADSTILNINVNIIQTIQSMHNMFQEINIKKKKIRKILRLKLSI